MKILPGRKYVNNVAMLDLIFLLLLTIVFMFIILLSILKTKTADPAIENRNQYVISMDWDAGATADVDMWVLDPTNQWVSYKKRQAPGMLLQHDDLGSSTDTVRRADGTIVINPLNREVVNIRTFHPGRYYVNAHLYKLKQKEPVTVTVKLMQVTPFAEWTSQEVVLTTTGQERTLLTFDLDRNGKVTLMPPVEYQFVLRKRNQHSDSE